MELKGPVFSSCSQRFPLGLQAGHLGPCSGSVRQAQKSVVTARSVSELKKGIRAAASQAQVPLRATEVICEALALYAEETRFSPFLCVLLLHRTAGELSHWTLCCRGEVQWEHACSDGISLTPPRESVLKPPAGQGKRV